MLNNLITKIYIENLFGLYTYSLPKNGDFSGASILYGDNGVGKSTILRLVFHLLSISNSRGHRTALYEAQFDFFKVELNSKIILTAKFKEAKGLKILDLKIFNQKKLLASWEYHPKKEKEEMLFETSFSFKILKDETQTKHIEKKKTGIKTGNLEYLNVLKDFVPTMFILNADRRLDSDSVSDPNDELEIRKVMRYEEPKRINEHFARSREIALSQAMKSAEQWIAKKAVIGANQGSVNVHSVYEEILKHIEAPEINSKQKSTIKEIKSIIEKLDTVEKKTKQLAKYELSSKLSTQEFKNIFKGKSSPTKLFTLQILRPYIQSLESRLAAVEPIYSIIDKFISIINDFLSDKIISFRLSESFTIHNTRGTKLGPAQLSSGEQQLLLLFCYVLTARDQPSIFMIDEPEISLNIKWQRNLIQSLLDITSGASIQFIFASHSMELLSQHRKRVVKLESN